MIEDRIIITPELTIKQVLALDPGLINFFQDQHFGYEHPGPFDCRVCPLAETETLGEAANSHGILIEEVIRLLYQTLRKQHSIDLEDTNP